MRCHLLVLLLCCHTAALFATLKYQPGDTLYVWAPSGLILRDAPDLQGGKITTIPYGTPLVVQNHSGEHTTSVVAAATRPKAVTLRGDFAMVGYDGKTGFVFDGFLSRFPSFTRSFASDLPVEPVWEGHIDWAIRCFNLQLKTVKGNPVAGAAHACQWIFGNGIVIDIRVEKGGETRIILPDVSMEEAFLIFDRMTDFSREVEHPLHDAPWSANVDYPYVWYFGAGNCSYTVRYLPDVKMAIISSRCAC